MSSVARRYAQALLELAREAGQVDQVANDLGRVKQSWDQSVELRSVFESPDVGPAARRDVLSSISKRLELSSSVQSTLKLLSDRRRMDHLPGFVDTFSAMAAKEQGRIRAQVRSATPLSGAYLDRLKSALETITQKRLVLEPEQDDSLVAGVIVQVGDQVFDGSVRNRLSTMKQELL